MTHPVAGDPSHTPQAARIGHRSPIIVLLTGDLDIVSAPVLRERLLSLLRPGASQLVIDLSPVGYADASGLAVLVNTQRRAVLLDGGLRLAAPRPEVATVLTVTGIGRHLDIYPTVKAAIAGWGSPACEAGPRGRLADTAVSALPARTRSEGAANSGEFRTAVADLLANADAWRDADPHRRFSLALRALAQAHAGSSHAALSQAVRSLLSVLSKEPLTYSPVVAATASRLRHLFSTGDQSAVAVQCRAV